jgi:hypothetical protein
MRPLRIQFQTQFQAALDRSPHGYLRVNAYCRILHFAVIKHDPEFSSFAVLTNRKSKEAAAAGDDLSSLWS